MEKLFLKYPTIFYEGLECVDLTKRVKILDQHKNEISLFNPLELKSGLRADHIADAYYEDAEMDWMVYLANEIVDPYYGWYLDEHDFDKYIDQKYGSFEAAIKKIKYYRNNWAQDMSQITVSHYNTNLAWDEKQYWTPIYGQGPNVIGYERKKQNWTMNTNRILQYDIFYSTDAQFSNNEIVDLKVGETLGTGEVITSNLTHLIIQHVQGNTSANVFGPKEIVGESSGATAFTNNMIIVSENISNAQSKYWRPVNHLDWELEQNESKKLLNIIDNNVAFDLSEQLRVTLSED